MNIYPYIHPLARPPLYPCYDNYVRSILRRKRYGMRKPVKLANFRIR